MAVSYRPNSSDYLLAEAAPDCVAVVEADGRYTYGQLRSAAGSLAAELAALELPPGSRVGVLGPNSFFWVAAYLAVMKLNHVAVPFSDKLAPDDVRRNADTVGCTAVFADRRILHRFSEAFGRGVSVLTDEALRSSREPYWPSAIAVDGSADAVLMFTSGTTSRPKAVRVTHENIQANTDSIIEYLGLRSDDRVLVILPFFYCYGASLLHTHLRRGARVVLCN
jgi:long-chain acyl-CoA synthetase